MLVDFNRFRFRFRLDGIWILPVFQCGRTFSMMVLSRKTDWQETAVSRWKEDGACLCKRGRARIYQHDNWSNGRHAGRRWEMKKTSSLLFYLTNPKPRCCVIALQRINRPRAVSSRLKAKALSYHPSIERQQKRHADAKIRPHRILSSPSSHHTLARNFAIHNPRSFSYLLNSPPRCR